MLKIEKDLNFLRKDGTLQNLVVRAPGGFGTTDDFNSGNVIAFLRPWEDRSITTAEVATIINKVIAEQPGVRGNAAPRSGLGRGRGLPVNIVLAGSTYEGLVAARDRIMAAAANYPGLINLDSDYKESKPQMRIETNLQ